MRSCFPYPRHQLTSTCVWTRPSPVTTDELSVLSAKASSSTCASNPIPFNLLKDSLSAIHFSLSYIINFPILLGHPVIMQTCYYFPHLKKKCFNLILPFSYHPFLSVLLQRNSTKALPILIIFHSPSLILFYAHSNQAFTSATSLKGPFPRLLMTSPLLTPNVRLLVLFLLDLPEALETESHSLLETPASVGLQHSILSWSSSTHWPLLLSLHCCFILTSLPFSY